jgi:hypothetical protein
MTACSVLSITDGFLFDNRQKAARGREPSGLCDELPVLLRFHPSTKSTYKAGKRSPS